MYGCELDYKERWAPKNWCFWTMVLEKTLESPWDCKRIQPVHPKGNQSWIFIGRSDAEAETPIFWPPNEKNWFLGKDPDAEKDWRQEEKGTTEDEMVGWHHWLDGHELEQVPGVGDGLGRLVCGSPRVAKSQTQLRDWTELIIGKLQSYDKPRQCIKKQRCHFADKGPYSQSYGLSSSHVGMWELDHKEG